MNKLFTKKISILLFIFIPIIFLWHPNWIGFLGIQPYWPLFWLLPWSMVYGSESGLIFGLFLGLILDAIISSSFTQIPGLILCGLWFGKISNHNNFLLGHFRHGLVCSIGSFMCSGLYFLQIMIKNFPENKFLFLYPSLKNIIIQVFLTGLFAPLICSQLLVLFKRTKGKNILINFVKK